MKRYFDDLDTLHRFTLALDSQPHPIPCQHCAKQGQFVSHGFVYKKHHQGERRTVGKRLFCSNRHGRSGCGRTIRLYLATELVFLHYTTVHLTAFLFALLGGSTIQHAYRAAQCLAMAPQAATQACRLPGVTQGTALATAPPICAGKQAAPYFVVQPPEAFLDPGFLRTDSTPHTNGVHIERFYRQFSRCSALNAGAAFPEFVSNTFPVLHSRQHVVAAQPFLSLHALRRTA